MAAYEHADMLTPGGPTGARSFAIIGAAIVAVGIFSSTLIMGELVSPPPAAATIAATARTWDLQPRWWPGELRQVNRQALPDNDLTFANGYAQRVAARQAAQQASVAVRVAANEPPAVNQSRRPAIVAHKASTVARTDAAPSLRQVAAARIDTFGDRPGQFNVGSNALAFGEQRPSQQALAGPWGPPFGSLFGNLY